MPSCSNAKSSFRGACLYVVLTDLRVMDAARHVRRNVIECNTHKSCESMPVDAASHDARERYVHRYMR
jgi:hypothetical protein